MLQVPLAERSQIQRLGDLPIQSSAGLTVPLRELGHFQRAPEEDIIYHKDLRAVEYVVADVGGVWPRRSTPCSRSRICWQRGLHGAGWQQARRCG